MKRCTTLMMAAMLAGLLGEGATAAAQLPDFSCRIEVWRDQARTQFIPGNEIAFGGGVPSIWIVGALSTQNVVGLVVPALYSGIGIRNNGVKLVGTPWPGPHQVVLRSTTNRIEVSGIVDVGNLVAESNESNNTCRRVLIATVAR